MQANFVRPSHLGFGPLEVLRLSLSMKFVFSQIPLNRSLVGFKVVFVNIISKGTPRCLPDA